MIANVLQWPLYAMAAILAFATNAFSADIRLSDSKYALLIEGEIKAGDYERVTDLLTPLSSLPLSVSLDSPGGDVEEAIKIGKFVRSGLFTSVISEGGRCNSACFVIWASAVRRIPSKSAQAKLGLHRPFFGRKQFSGLSASDANRSYRDLDAYFRAYLIELQVPSDIVELIFRTKSTEAVFIADIDMIDKLGQEAPFFEEWLIAKCGELSGEEDLDYKLLIAADIMQMQGTSLASTTTGAQKIQSMSAGYKKYLRENGSRIAACNEKAEDEERRNILRLLQQKSGHK